MATGFAARFDAAADFGLQKRVAQALAEQAVTVYNELNTTPLHAARVAYALAVIGDPPSSLVFNGIPIQADKRSFSVTRLLVSLGIDNTSTDAQIATQLASAWNALAGA